MIKSLVLALTTAAAALGATSAHAGGVSWSIGINTPVIGTVISNAPRYCQPAYEPVYAPAYAPVYAPVYAPTLVYSPAPVHAPVPVYRPAPRTVYYPAPEAYRSVPVIYPRSYPGWRHERWVDRHDRHERHERDERHERWEDRGHR